MKKIAKRGILCLMSALLLLACLTACGGSGKGADMNALQEAMLSADSTLPEMTTVSSDSEGAEDLFSYLSDVDYSKVESYFLSYSADGLADEVAVVRMKKSGDVNEMEKSLRSHVDDRVSLFKSYDPEQVDRAEAADIFVSGNDVVLVISDNAALVKNAYSSVNAE